MENLPVIIETGADAVGMTDLEHMPNLPAIVRSSEAVKKIGMERWSAIEALKGPEYTRNLMGLISNINSGGGISAAAETSWDDETADDKDSAGLGVRYVRVCRRLNDDLSDAGVTEGDFFTTDPVTQKPVSLGKTLKGVIPLQLHNERTLFEPEAEEFQGCRSLDAVTGSAYGSCETCKFNTFYRSTQEKAGKVIDVPLVDGKPAKCTFNKCMYFVFEDRPWELCMIQFSSYEAQSGFKTLQKLLGNPLQKKVADNGRGWIWSTYGMKVPVSLSCTRESFEGSKHKNFYITQVKSGDLLIKEMLMPVRALATLAQMYYEMRLSAAQLKATQAESGNNLGLVAGDAKALPESEAAEGGDFEL